MAKNRISRQALYSLIFGGGLVALTLALFVTMYFASRNKTELQSKAYLSPQEHGNQTNFRGFNTQLRITDPAQSGLNAQAFRKTVDDIAALGLAKPMLRITLPADEIFPHTKSGVTIRCPSNPSKSAAATTENCDANVLTQIRDSLAYANKKGVKIMAVTSVPSWATMYSTPAEADRTWKQKYSLDEYLLLTTNVHRELARNFGQYVEVWNLFNESNIYAFDTHQPVNLNNESTYISQFQKVFLAAADATRKYDPGSPVTHDVAGIPKEGSADYGGWVRFVKAIAPSLNWGSTNLYFGDIESDITSIPDRLTVYQNILQKPVAVTETGLCTQAYSEKRQGELMALYIKQVLSFRPEAALLYQYQDDKTSWFDGCAQTYGIVSASRTKKESYTTVTNALKGIYADVVKDHPATCTVTKSESFDTPLTGWTTATDQPQASGVLTQKPGQWAIDTTAQVSGDFKVEITHHLASLGEPFENWAATTYAFYEPGNYSKDVFSVRIMRENAGYSLHLLQNGVDKFFTLGNGITTVQTLGIQRQGEKIFLTNGAQVIGVTNNLALEKVSTGPLQLGIVTETAGQPTATLIDTLRYFTCQR